METMQQVRLALDRVRRVAGDRNDQQLQMAMGSLRRTIIALGATRRLGAPAAGALTEPFLAELYPRLCAAYQAVGQPCGPDDTDMLRWLCEQAAIAAETERRQQERLWQRGLEMLHDLILEAGAPCHPRQPHDHRIAHDSRHSRRQGGFG